MAAAASLWTELCGLLQARGELPFQVDLLTPAEVATAVRAANGDRRPHDFVWNYFYPRHYGDADGSLSEAGARALVNSFKARAAPPPAAAADAPQAVRCGICHARPVQGRA